MSIEETLNGLNRYLELCDADVKICGGYNPVVYRYIKSAVRHLQCSNNRARCKQKNVLNLPVQTPHTELKVESKQQLPQWSCCGRTLDCDERCPV